MAPIKLRDLGINRSQSLTSICITTETMLIKALARILMTKFLYLKSGILSSDEYEYVKRETIKGFELLAEIIEIRKVCICD